MNKTYFLCACVCVLTLVFDPISVSAQTRVVVVPLGGDEVKPLKNVVTVSPANGDFTNPITALNSISEASATNPYLVVIGPGVYDIGSSVLNLKEYVDIVGSGKNTTVIQGSLGGSTLDNTIALVIGASNTSLKNLTISNSINLSNNAATVLFNDQVSMEIDNVKFSASNSAASLAFTNGIRNQSSTIRIVDSIIESSTPNSISSGRGVENDDGSMSMIINSEILNFLDSIRNVTVVDSFKISNSTLDGVVNTPGTGTSENGSYISDSILSRAVNFKAGLSPQCSFNFLSDGTALDQNCED